MQLDGQWDELGQGPDWLGSDGGEEEDNNILFTYKSEWFSIFVRTYRMMFALILRVIPPTTAPLLKGTNSHAALLPNWTLLLL